MKFEWDDAKEVLNQKKHGVSFNGAQKAFLDKYRVIAEDLDHSNEKEQRYFCFGEIRPVAKQSFAGTGRLKKIATATKLRVAPLDNS